MNAGKGIAGHGNGAPPEPQPQPPMQVAITRKIHLLAANVEVAQLQNGNRELSITDLGTREMYVVTLPPEASREIGRGLLTSLEVASADRMPPEPEGRA